MVDGVVQLGVGVGQFLAVHHQFEALGQLRIVAVTLAERRHLDRIVGDEGWLDVGAFALLAEDLVDQLALAHRGIDLDVELLAHVAQLGFVHACDVDARLLLDAVDHRDTLEGTLEADFVVAYLHGFLAQDVHHAAMNHLFGVVHHPKVVLVGHVDFQSCKFGVMGAVHTLVAEVA